MEGERQKAPPAFALLGHLPTSGGGFLAGKARAKGAPLCGELAELARPEGLWQFTLSHNLKKSCLHNQCRQDFYFITLLNQNATFLAT